MAVIWVFLAVLARLGAADIPGRESGGRLDDFEQLFSDLEIPRGTPEEGSYFPVQVWKFLIGKKVCTHGSAGPNRTEPWLKSGSMLSVLAVLHLHLNNLLEMRL